ncbi:MAG TPA: homoserine O-succinyltransferase [Alphaproteobacteria bacterium]|nr:homoserine O-succinyltransferase [Alphaproteobacteria bacterium]
MPIVKASDLPTYDRLIKEGRPVLPPDRAITQDIRELHIGFLNLMPDAALEATERQWFRLIGESNRVAQIYVHPFTLPVFERGKEAQSHIDAFYDQFEKLQEDGLDALIVTGANEETNPHVSDVETWGPLRDVLTWSYENVTSTICSCLASHALMTYYHNQKPSWRETKMWGVFSHRVIEREHPLIRGMNTKFDVPHSRFSEITRDQYDKAGMITLIESKEAGVHMAVSKDGFRQICLQGHPEYDTASLLKEYKRDVGWYQDGQIDYYPPFPAHYFGPKAQAISEDIKTKIQNGEKADFPEDEIYDLLENTWADSARSMLSSWIGHVYQTTHVERKKQFMDGVDPNNPLGI